MSRESFNIERVQANLQAIIELRKSQPDLAILKKYTGWGGLRNAIYNPDVYRVLKKHCTVGEIASMKQSTDSAYFTPKPLINFIFDALLQLKRPFSSVLEPSAGHGLFFENMPKQFGSHRQAVEIDKLSINLLKALYPDIKVHADGFETFHSEMLFDLIIGNPPYGQAFVKDERHSDIASLRIHHYFVAKCMRMLASGGVLAMILPKYFMDNCKEHAREIIAKEGGSLLAAFRLPDNLFADAKVTVDVVFLIKEPSKLNWVTCEKRWIDRDTVYINRYFLDNPSHVMGKFSLVDAYGRLELTCRQESESQDVFGMLRQQLEFFPPQKLPSIEECKARVAKRLLLIEKKIQSLNQLKQELTEAERHLHLMERQWFKSWSSQINLELTAV